MAKQENGDGFTLTLPVRWSIVGAGAVIFLTGIYYWIVGEWAKTIIFAAAATAAAATVLAAGYTGRTLNLFLRQDSRIREREAALDRIHRCDSAMRFAERWNDPQMYHVRNVFRSVVESRSLPQEELIALIEREKTNVIHILNFLEEIAFSRKNELSDEELIRTQFEGIVVILWSTVEPWITSHRRDRGRPKIWCMLEEVYREWR